MQSISIVPCELCGQPIPFNAYEEHMKLHKADVKKEKEDEEQEDEDSASSLPLVRTKGHLVISCEVCGEIIQFKTYKEHLEMHKDRPKAPAVPIPGT